MSIFHSANELTPIQNSFSFPLSVGPRGRVGQVEFCCRKHFRTVEGAFVSGLLPWSRIRRGEQASGPKNDAFLRFLYFIASKRLTTGKLVSDRSHECAGRKAPQAIIALARQFHCIRSLSFFDLPEKLCHERNVNRPDRDFVHTSYASISDYGDLSATPTRGFRKVHICIHPGRFDAGRNRAASRCGTT